MRKTCYLIATGLLAAFAVLPAQAQWYDDDQDEYGYDGYGHDGYGYGYNSGTFRCESRDRRTTRCPTRGYHVQFIRQYSDMPCVRGRSWGQDRYGVWVTNGCRALFRYDNRGNWGWNDGWDNGWNSGGGDFVRCESRDNRSRTCQMSVGRHGDIRLVRQLSDTPCVEGHNWGRSRSGVWVSGGCRAEFVVSRGRGRGWGDASGDYGSLPRHSSPGLPMPRADGPSPGDADASGGPVHSPFPREERRRRDVEWHDASGDSQIVRPRHVDVGRTGTSSSASGPGVFQAVSEPSRSIPEPQQNEEAIRETP
jgi:hypothetical protein